MALLGRGRPVTRIAGRQHDREFCESVHAQIVRHIHQRAPGRQREPVEPRAQALDAGQELGLQPLPHQIRNEVQAEAQVRDAEVNRRGRLGGAECVQDACVGVAGIIVPQPWESGAGICVGHEVSDPRRGVASIVAVEPRSTPLVRCQIADIIGYVHGDLPFVGGHGATMPERQVVGHLGKHITPTGSSRRPSSSTALVGRQLLHVPRASSSGENKVSAQPLHFGRGADDSLCV